MSTDNITVPGQGAVLAFENINGVEYQKSKLIDSTPGSTNPIGTVGNPLNAVDPDGDNPDQPQTVQIVGDPSGDFAGVNLLEAIVDPTSPNALTVSVAEQKPPLRDANNALRQSDAPAPIQFVGQATQSIIIDTQGYQSMNITSFAQVANVLACNDPEGTFAALSGTNLVIAAAYVTATAANSSFSFPCIARFIKLTITTAGAAMIYLRAAPWVAGYATPIPSNISQLAGTGPVTAGVAGTLAVGGNIAVGSAPTTNPLNIGGWDGVNTRRMLLDTTGRVQTNLVARDVMNVDKPIPLALGSSFGTPSIPVKDTSVEDGQTLVELLAAIQRELMIANHYLADLPRQLNAGIAQTDEPAAFRNDPSFFNQ